MRRVGKPERPTRKGVDRGCRQSRGCGADIACQTERLRVASANGFSMDIAGQRRTEQVVIASVQGLRIGVAATEQSGGEFFDPFGNRKIADSDFAQIVVQRLKQMVGERLRQIGSGRGKGRQAHDGEAGEQRQQFEAAVKCVGDAVVHVKRRLTHCRHDIAVKSFHDPLVAGAAEIREHERNLSFERGARLQNMEPGVRQRQVWMQAKYRRANRRLFCFCIGVEGMLAMRRQSKLMLGKTDSRSRAARGLLLALLLAAPLTGCVGYDGDLQTGYVLDDRQMEQVRAGSSAEQVLVVMGSPSTTSTVGGSAWYYISSHQTQSFAFQKPNVIDRRVFAIYFDDKKRVERIANYGLQDGKVFDFNTRTTPTAGGEASFVKNLLQGLLRYQS